MNKYGILLVLLLLVIVQISCGNSVSGTWIDDSENWKRAFESQQPTNVIVIHSYYWRSPHFTMEYEYYFEIEANKELEEQLFSQNDLLEVENLRGVDFPNPPDWFTPKSIDTYEIWRMNSNPERNFYVFVDKDTGELFITDYLY